MTKRRRTAGQILSLAALTTMAVITLQAAAPAKVEIGIDNFTFSPAVITVKPGTQITWANRDGIPHTVVSDTKAFKSKVLATGEKFTYTAAKPGVYSYACSIHPNMTGKVVVQ